MGEVSTPDDLQETPENRVAHNIEIEEVSESDEIVNGGPEPVITEQEEVSEMAETVHVERTEMFTEIQTVIILI